MAAVLFGNLSLWAQTSQHADAAAVAGEIDRQLEAHWQLRGIAAATSAAEPQLLRRVTLDLVGRIPTKNEYEAAAKLGGRF